MIKKPCRTRKHGHCHFDKAQRVEKSLLKMSDFYLKARCLAVLDMTIKDARHDSKEMLDMIINDAFHESKEVR